MGFFFVIQVSKKYIQLDRGVGGWRLTNPSFSLIFFNLTKPLRKEIKNLHDVDECALF